MKAIFIPTNKEDFDEVAFEIYSKSIKEAATDYEQSCNIYGDEYDVAWNVFHEKARIALEIYKLSYKFINDE